MKKSKNLIIYSIVLVVVVVVVVFIYKKYKKPAVNTTNKIQPKSNNMPKDNITPIKKPDVIVDDSNLIEWEKKLNITRPANIDAKKIDAWKLHVQNLARVKFPVKNIVPVVPILPPHKKTGV